MVNEPKQPHQVLTATPCNQSSGADPRLDYALYESLIQDHNSPLEQRLHHCLSVFLGRAYEFDPLGDGLSCRIDRRSRLQTASFDCMTFCSTVLAMVCSQHYDHFVQNMDATRYGTQSPGYLHRHHFIETQWNPSNRHLGFLYDLMKTIDLPVKTHKQFIDYPNWIRHQQRYVQSRFRCAEFTEQEIPTQFTKACQTEIDFIPLQALTSLDQQKNHEQALRLPVNTVAQLVCPDWQVQDKIGTSITVCHLGILTRKDDIVYFTHAKQKRSVESVPLVDYLKFISDHFPHVSGIHLEGIRLQTLPGDS